MDNGQQQGSERTVKQFMDQVNDLGEKILDLMIAEVPDPIVSMTALATTLATSIELYEATYGVSLRKQMIELVSVTVDQVEARHAAESKASFN